MAATGQRAAPLLRGDVPRLAARKVWQVIVEFDRRGLLTYASSIAFRILFAIIPFVCFALAVLGFLHLQSVWQNDVAPTVRSHVSQSVYAVIDQTVRQVLNHQQLFWLTGGLAIAWWEVSGAVRAVMSAFEVIYVGAGPKRSLISRTLASLWLSAVVGVCWLGAFAALNFLPLLGHGEAWWVAMAVGIGRWVIAVALLCVAVGSLVRYAPERPRPLPWVSVGTGAAVVLWLLASLGYWVYLTRAASYGSIFGNLASVMVLMSFLYLSAVVFLAGALLDAILRREAEGPDAEGGTRADA